MNLTLTLVPWQLWHMFVKQLIYFEIFILTNIIFLKIRYFPSQKICSCNLFNLWKISSFLKIKLAKVLWYVLFHVESLCTLHIYYGFCKVHGNQGYFNNLGHVFTCSDINFAWCHFESLAFTLPCDPMVVGGHCSNNEHNATISIICGVKATNIIPTCMSLYLFSRNLSFLLIWSCLDPTKPIGTQNDWKHGQLESACGFNQLLGPY